MTPSDDDRIAYLAGEDVASLPADELAALDALRDRAGRSPRTWEEPPGDLEDHVVSGRIARRRAERAGPSRARARAVAWSRRGCGCRRRPALALSCARGGGRRRRRDRARRPARHRHPGAPVCDGRAGDAACPGRARLGHADEDGVRAGGSSSRRPGLPRRDGKEFYQAWLKNAAGVLVPVGTFNDARKVTLWSGVPVTKFRTLTVTQQVANGDPASSGRQASSSARFTSRHPVSRSAGSLANRSRRSSVLGFETQFDHDQRRGPDGDPGT